MVVVVVKLDCESGGVGGTTVVMLVIFVMFIVVDSAMGIADEKKPE